jgi:hypothetical protein
VRGQTVESFISQSQDRQRNAMQKSVQAAFRAWQEQLASDQVIFEQQQIMLLSLTRKSLSMAIVLAWELKNTCWVQFKRIF